MERNEYRVNRPWGHYTILQESSHHWIKKLHINKDARLSLQSHDHRNEVWIVVKGIIYAQIADNYILAKQSEVLFVPKGAKHRIWSLEEALVLEMAYGKVCESDITRYEDDYGRELTPA